MWIEYNANPVGAHVGDCAVRAVSLALGIPWEDAYKRIADNGLQMGDVISSNNVWGSVLRQNGFRRYNIPNICPDCYTIREFCRDHPDGLYVVGTGSHVVTVIDGNYYDSWNSGDEVPAYYWRR